MYLLWIRFCSPRCSHGMLRLCHIQIEAKSPKNWNHAWNFIKTVKSHCEFLLLRASFSLLKVSYMARTCPPSSSDLGLWENLDDLIRDSLNEILGLSLSDKSWISQWFKPWEHQSTWVMFWRVRKCYQKKLSWAWHRKNWAYLSIQLTWNILSNLSSIHGKRRIFCLLRCHIATCRGPAACDSLPQPRAAALCLWVQNSSTVQTGNASLSQL